MGFRSTDTDETNGRDEKQRADAERRVRLGVLLSTYRTAIVVVLVLLLAVGAWASYGAYADRAAETDTNRQVSNTWTATGDVSHGATVTEATAVYPEGTRLENESLYYSAVSPTVDGEFVGGYEADTADDVRVTLSIELVYRTVDPDDGTVHWRERDRLASANETSVRPGEPVVAAFAVNVTEITARIDEIESDLGASPGETEIYLALEREVDGTIDGADRSVADSYTVPITVGDGTYRIEDEAGAAYDEPREDYETEAVPAATGLLWSVGGPLLVALGLGGIGALAVASRRLPEPTAADREWLAYRDDRAQFDEAVTTMAVPDAALEGPRARAESLAGLAEYGIDVDAAIVFDPERELYLVRRDGLVAVYEPPRPPSIAIDGEGDGTDGDDASPVFGAEPETDLEFEPESEADVNGDGAAGSDDGEADIDGDELFAFGECEADGEDGEDGAAAPRDPDSADGEPVPSEHWERDRVRNRSTEPDQATADESNERT